MSKKLISVKEALAILSGAATGKFVFDENFRAACVLAAKIITASQALSNILLHSTAEADIGGEISEKYE
jgi:hypothetical protein